MASIDKSAGLLIRIERTGRVFRLGEVEVPANAGNRAGNIWPPARR